MTALIDPYAWPPHPMIASLQTRLEEAVEAHRDLTTRLGFGDGVTEPQADNDTIVEWFDERTLEANEWQESQRWRDDCYIAGHPDDEDCFECDPSLRLERAEARLSAVTALADTADARPGTCHERGLVSTRLLRAAVEGER